MVLVLFPVYIKCPYRESLKPKCPDHLDLKTLSNLTQRGFFSFPALVMLCSLAWVRRSSSGSRSRKIQRVLSTKRRCPTWRTWRLRNGLDIGLCQEAQNPRNKNIQFKMWIKLKTFKLCLCGWCFFFHIFLLSCLLDYQNY